MGWQSEDLGIEHEGHLVGFVPDGPYSYRELTMRQDGTREPTHLRYVAVACECGWRSPMLLAPAGTDWTPCMVWLAHGSSDEIVGGYEESARKLWRVHIEDMRTHGHPMLRVDEDGFRAALDRKRPR